MPEAGRVMSADPPGIWKRPLLVAFKFKIATYESEKFFRERTEILKRVKNMVDHIMDDYGTISPVTILTERKINDEV